MADKYYCKKCGRDRSSISSLTSNSCPKGGSCEPYDGPIQSKYYCRKCGRDRSSISSLTSNSCPKGAVVNLMKEVKKANMYARNVGGTGVQSHH